MIIGMVLMAASVNVASRRQSGSASDMYGFPLYNKKTRCNSVYDNSFSVCSACLLLRCMQGFSSHTRYTSSTKYAVTGTVVDGKQSDLDFLVLTYLLFAGISV